MEEKDYKDRLLKRVCKYLKDNFVGFKIYNEDEGIVYLYEEGKNNNLAADMVYNIFHATLAIVESNEFIDPCIKENVVKLFHEHFGE